MNKDWLDIGILEDYLDGKLDAKTMNRVEREALEDPFVAEALAGLSESPKRSLQSISILQKQLQERIAEQQSVKKTSVITWQRLSIAAAAAVLFIAVSIMFWMRENNRQKELAGRAKKVEVNLAARDSVKAPAPVAAAPAETIEVATTNSYAVRTKAKSRAIQNEAVNPQQTQDEVVVVGYGTQQKQDLTGGVAFAAPAARNHVLAGKIVDGENGKPLPGVSVKMEGTNITAVTDAKGEFKFNADTSVKSAILRTAYVGFEHAETIAKINEPVNIKLTPASAMLNETIVVGYGKAKKQADTYRINEALSGKVAGIANKNKEIRIRGVATTTSGPVMVSNPVDGWDKLFAYINANNSFAKTEKAGQTVELSFRIAEDGSPEDIQVVQHAAPKYEAEAIRLILNGPKWERPKDIKSRMTFRIEF